MQIFRQLWEGLFGKADFTVATAQVGRGSKQQWVVTWGARWKELMGRSLAMAQGKPGHKSLLADHGLSGQLTANDPGRLGLIQVSLSRFTRAALETARRAFPTIWGQLGRQERAFLKYLEQTAAAAKAPAMVAFGRRGGKLIVGGQVPAAELRLLAGVGLSFFALGSGGRVKSPSKPATTASPPPSISPPPVRLPMPVPVAPPSP